MTKTSALRLGFICLLLLAIAACTGAKPVAPVAEPVMSDAEIITQLAGRIWVAEYIHGRPVIDMSHSSMVFTTEGLINGLGGCNNYRGNYTIKNGTITVPPVAATMKMCPPAISKQEDRFFHSMTQEQQVTFKNGLLYLTPKDGEPSVFSPRNME